MNFLQKYVVILCVSGGMLLPIPTGGLWLGFTVRYTDVALDGMEIAGTLEWKLVTGLRWAILAYNIKASAKQLPFYRRHLKRIYFEKIICISIRFI